MRERTRRFRSCVFSWLTGGPPLSLPLKANCVRKRRMVAVALGAGIVLVAVIMTGARCAAPEPKLGSGLEREDVPKIQQAVQRGRWKMIKTCVERREFKIAFTVCIPDLLFGRVREVSGARTFSPTKAAIAVSEGRHSRRVNYMLEQRTNGWQVIGF